MNGNAKQVLRSHIAAYNKSVGAYRTNCTSDNETICLKNRRYLTGFCDCLATFGYNVTFEYDGEQFITEIKGFYVSDGDSAVHEAVSLYDHNNFCC